jgi:hypothetical protein
MQKLKLREYLYTFFHSQLLKKEVATGDGFLAAGLAKNKLFTDMLGLLSPKTTIYLC